MSSSRSVRVSRERHRVLSIGVVIVKGCWGEEWEGKEGRGVDVGGGRCRRVLGEV